MHALWEMLSSPQEFTRPCMHLPQALTASLHPLQS